MKYRFLAWVAAAMALLVCIPGCDDVRFDLQIALDRLIEARMKRDADAYIRALDPKDLDEYDRLLSAARRATRAQIASLPPIERFHIATLRASLTGAQLRGLDQRGLIRATAPSWDIGEARFDITIGRVKHNPPRAQAQLVVNGTATNLWIEFVQTEDYWRLSERAFNDVFNQNVRDLARRMDRSEDYIVLMLARRASGKSFDDRIWDAPPR